MLERILDRGPINLDVGLLVLRLVIGLSMLGFHGWDKLVGGPELWAQIGGSMGNLGISFAPTFWGFLAAFAEAIGSLLLVLGVLFRPAAAMLAFTMVVAVVVHVKMPPESPNAGWLGASHALELLGVYVALLLTGAGRYVVGGSVVGSRSVSSE